MPDNRKSQVFGHIVRLLVDVQNLPVFLDYAPIENVVGTKSVCLCLSQDAYDLLKNLVLIPYQEQFYHFPDLYNAWLELYKKMQDPCKQETQTDEKDTSDTNPPTDGSGFSYQLVQVVDSITGAVTNKNILGVPQWVDKLLPVAQTFTTEIATVETATEFAIEIIPLLV